MSRRAARVFRTIVLVLGVVAPLTVVIAYVHVRGRNVPFWDQWELSSDIAIRAADGTLTLHDVLRQHNEHRLAPSNITTAVLAWTDGWNLKTEMYLCVVMAVLTLGLLLLALRADARDAAPIAVIPFAGLVLSLRQEFNWVMSLQTNLHFLMLFTLGALMVLRRGARRPTALVAAALLGVGATYTQGSGVLVWPIVLAALPLFGFGVGAALFWVGAAAVTMWTFLAGFAAPIRHVPPVRALEFLLAFVGNPFVREAPGLADLARIVAVLGMALLAANVIMLRSRGYAWRRLATWLALAGFALGIAALAAINRSHFGMRYALNSRYATQASVFWIAVIALGSMVVAEARRAAPPSTWRRALVAANLALGAAVVANNVHAAIHSWPVGFVSDAHVACVLCYPTTRDASCLSGLHPAFNPDSENPALRPVLLRRLDALAAHRLATFAGRDRPPPTCGTPADGAPVRGTASTR